MLHSTTILWQNMKNEASLCPVRSGKVVLMWEACRLDHMTDKVLVAYTTEVHKKNESP